MNRFCTACGKSLELETLFCGSCGKRVKREGGGSVDTSGAVGVAGGIGHSAKKAASPFTRPLGSKPKTPIDEPPESVFASTHNADDDTKPNVTPEADPAYYEEEQSDKDKRKYLIAGGIIALILLGGLYFWLFLSDDMGRKEGGRPIAAGPETPVEKKAEAKLYYATSTANIRDRASTEESEIIGKLTRGDEAKGVLLPISNGETGAWLELEDGKGFVFLANLSQENVPSLSPDFGRKTITLSAPVDLLSAPNENAELVDRLSKGLTINVSGITENDYAEVILRKGGVGYIADGAKIVKQANAPKGLVIAISLDKQGCAVGSGIEALFKKLDGEYEAERKKIEEADYANAAERDAAVDKFYNRVEGRSRYYKSQRNFKGLQMTAIARHYEAQSVYFADPIDKVMSVFREAGYKVSKDGQLPSKDIYAGIYATKGPESKYGKTELECGV